MKRLLAVVPMIFVVACAGTYQPPKAIAPESSLLFQNSKIAVFKAAQQVLIAEGYQITNANEASGTISTARRALQLTPEQADCGNCSHGLKYVEDWRASIWVGLGVIVEEGKLTVKANIQGEYKESGGQKITFPCVSRGSLEKSLMEKIMMAASSK
ncbi:MAG: hypothetical protein ACLQED_04915 [Desulfobaccales bacterium]